MSFLPKTPSFRLDGKRALVAGASSGIGAACAVALAQAGAHVVLASRRVEPMKEMVQALLDEGCSAEAVHLDIADFGSIKSLIQDQAPFDVMINSAGIARQTPALETQEQDFDDVMNVNVKGAYFIARETAAKMLEAGIKGSIISLSSQMGHVGGQRRAVYCATKHAVEGFTKSMAIEWGKSGIRVNTICPTFVHTPLTEQAFANEEQLAWILSMIKLERVAEVEDIMGAALFLASDASAMVTGTSILIDGGWTAD